MCGGGELLPAILRIDMDRAYEKKILYYMRVNSELFLRIGSLLHLKSCKELMEYLHDLGTKAFMFFQPFTVPNKESDEE